MDLILAYLSFPYEKIDEANKKYLEMLPFLKEKVAKRTDLFEPKLIQQTMPWYTEDSVRITTIFGVRKGKLKEAIEILNFRKKLWPVEEGYKVDVWTTAHEGKKRPLIFGEKYLIFVSYATKDAEMFKIGEITKRLTNFPEIKKVLYWQEHMHDNIFKFMNDNLGKCDVMLLFCSKNSLNSIPVGKEWTAAEAIGLPIIPIFFDVDHIPPLLKSRLGIEYNINDIDKIMKELRVLILKKIKGVSD